MSQAVSLGAAATLLLACCTAAAQTGNPSLGRTGVPGGRQIDRHNPYSPSYIDMRPGGHLLHNVSQGHISQRHHGHRHHHHRGRGPYARGYGYDPYGYGYSLYDSYGYGYGYTSYTGYGAELWVPRYRPYYPTVYPYPVTTYPYGYTGQYGPYSIYGPLVLPTGAVYGVRHLNSIVPGAVPTVVAKPQAAPQEVEPAEPEPVPPRVSNREARGRALRFIEFGDRHFAGERYFDAYQRYKSASQAAPDVARAYFRQGFALAALGRYERAFETMRRGVALDGEWSKSTFRLTDLFGDNDEARAAHLEQLADFIDLHPQHGEAMFLLGVSLYFDGQAERSRPFLQRAKELLEVELADGLPEGREPAAEPAAAEQPAPEPKPAADPEELPLEI